MSFWAIDFLGSSTIGGPIVGWVGEYAGPRWALALGGLAAVFAASLGWKVLSSAPERTMSAVRKTGAAGPPGVSRAGGERISGDD